MKTQNQKRRIALILLISMLAQNCGLEVPADQSDAPQTGQAIVDQVQDKDDAQQHQSLLQTVTSIAQELGPNYTYHALADRVWDQFALKIRQQDDDQNIICGIIDAGATDKASTFRDLEQIALAGLQRDTLVLDKDAIQEVLGGCQLPKALEDTEFWLLQPMDQGYKFPYLTLQEYFAGRRLARLCLSDHANDATTLTCFLKSHMYNPRYRRTLCFMAGEMVEGIAQEIEITQENKLPVQQLLNTLSTLPQEVLGLQHLTLQIRLINECLTTEATRCTDKTALDALEVSGIDESLERWFKEGIRHYRKSEVATQAIHHTLLISLAEAGNVRRQYSDKLMFHIQAALQSHDSDARTAATEALPTFVADGTATATVLSYVQSALRDSDSDVRRTGLVSLQALVNKGVSLSSCLPGIEVTFHDTNFLVRRAALVLLCTLVDKDQEVPAIYTFIQSILHDSAWYVREAAIKVLKALSLKSDVSPEILPHVQHALVDSDWRVRAAALDALHTLLATGRVSPSVCLSHVQAACQDNKDCVREAALALLPALVDQGVEASDLLAYIQHASKDWSEEVRRCARNTLDALVNRGMPLAMVISTLTSSLNYWHYYALMVSYQYLPTLSQEGGLVFGTPPCVQDVPQVGVDIPSYAAMREALQTLKAGAEVSSVFPVIQQALQDNNDDLIRATALQILPSLVAKGLAAPHALPCIQDARSDDSPLVRRSALIAMQALVRIGVEVPDVFAYIQQAFQDSFVHVRIAALGLLRALVDKDAEASVVFPLVQQILSDDDRSILYTARDMLRTLVEKCQNTAEVLPHIQEALQHSEDRCRTANRRAFQYTIEGISDVTDVLPTLHGMLQKADNDICVGGLRAVPALLQKGVDASAISQIIQSTLQHSDREIRLAASQVLPLLVEKLGNSEDIFALIQHALQDDDNDVRATVRRALAAASTVFMIDYYWRTKDIHVISLLVPRLYQSALTLQAKSDSDQQQLVLYPSLGEPVQWEVAHEEVVQLRHLIQDAAPYSA